jgi:hypothetical protein
MTKFRCAIAMLCALMATASSMGEDNKAPEGFTALFNGKDLTGWKGAVDMGQRLKLKGDDLTKAQKAADEAVKELWFVEEGAIRLVPKPKVKGFSLATAKDYGDFELLLDWKIEAKGDSGLYLRGMPQVQIWDSDNLAPNLKDDAGKGSGGLWNNPKDEKYGKGKQPLKKADKPVGEWNTFRIIMKGENVTIFLNNEKVIDNAPLAPYGPFGYKELPKEGPIELQFHGDKLWFKNIYIKELK